MREIKFRAWVKKFHNPDYEAWAKQKEDSYFYGRNKSRVTVYEEETNNSFNKGFVSGMDYYPVISEGYYAVMNGCEISGENENVPLMQFTGLLDRNGKEIYEGDIVKYRTYPNQIIDIKFEKGAFTAGEHNGSSTAIRPKLIVGRLVEVIGNIYESKHLLDNTDMKV